MKKRSAKNFGNNAQMIGQVFIFILAGLVFVLIITYGYKAISQLTERQEQVVLADFQTNLERAVDSVKREYGTVRKLTLTLPGEYRGACFFDYDTCATEPPTLELPAQTIRVPWAQEACQLKGANVFLVPRALDLSLPDIHVDKGYVCIPNTDGITLRLEGTGRTAKLSAWT